MKKYFLFVLKPLLSFAFFLLMNLVAGQTTKMTHVDYRSSAAAPSAASDIIANSSYAYRSNLAYATYQSAVISNTGSSAGGSIDIFKFDIRDGGGIPDTDDLPTILSSVTFNVTNISVIRSASLFSGNSLVNASPTINALSGTISFSGLSGTWVTAADDGFAGLTLRVTFTSAVTDNIQLQVSIHAADATAAGGETSSLFTAFPNVVSSTVSDQNRIEVTADRLAFVQQPTTTPVGAAMMPAVSVSANDANGNRDLDFADNVDLSSTGLLSGTPKSGTLNSGVFIFDPVIHTVSGTGLILTATASGLATNTVDSGSFTILETNYANNDYRSKTPGTWEVNAGMGTGTATWEQYNSETKTWSAAGIPAGTNRVYINTSIEVTGGTYASASITIENGGNLKWTEGSAWTVSNMLINAGGILQIDSKFTMDSSGTFEIEDDGTVNFNYSSYTGNELSTTLWKGSEIFHPESNFVIQNQSFASSDYFIPSNADISTNNYNGFSACFGNLIFDSVGTSRYTFFGNNFSQNLTHQDLIFRSATVSSNSVNLTGSSGLTTIIGRNLIVEENFGRPVTVTTAENGNSALTVRGHFSNQSSQTFNIVQAASGSAKMDVEGKMTLAGSSNLLLNGVENSTASSAVNLEGNLSVNSEAALFSLSSSSDGTVFNFSGTYNVDTPTTIQTVDVASTSGIRNQYINFTVNSGAYVQLLNHNFELGKNSTFTVDGSGNTGGILDFNFSDNTPLNLTSYSSGSKFVSRVASTLKISSAEGISATSGTSGNVQVTNAPTYNSVATFHYIGKMNQFTGSGLPTASSAKIVIVELADNSRMLTLTNEVGISSGTALDDLGGKLEIRKGTVLGTSTADFKGGGRLVMTGGEYRISTVTTDPSADYLPQLRNYSKYSLTGGTVNLSATGGIQILSGTPSYYNIKTSGTNLLGTDYKGISSATSVSNIVEIAETSILDVKNSTLGGSSTKLMMTDTGRYRTAGSGTQPVAGGSYSLAPTTTVEFYGNAATNIRLSPTYGNILVSGTNVTIASTSSGLKFQAGGSFTVGNGGVFKLFHSTGFAGSTSTAINTNNTPSIILVPGSTVEYSAGADQIITNKTNFAEHPDYAHLVVSGGGTKTSSGETVVKELTTVAGSTILKIPETVDDVAPNIFYAGGGISTPEAHQFLLENNAVLLQDPTADNTNAKIKQLRNVKLKRLQYVYWGTSVEERILKHFSPNTVSTRFYTYNEVDDTFAVIPNIDTSPMVGGKGYVIRSPNNFPVDNSTTAPMTFQGVFAGKPNNSMVTATVVKSSTGAGNNLLGNPYPSNLDLHNLTAQNGSILTGNYYMWTNYPDFLGNNPPTGNGQTGNYASNHYALVNNTGGMPADNSSIIPSAILKPGQGFIAEAKASGEVNFSPARTKEYVDQFSKTAVFYTKSAPSDAFSRYWLRLKTPSGNIRTILVGYLDGAVNEYDPGYDARSRTGGSDSFYSIIEDQKLAIQGRKWPFNPQDIVTIGYSAYETGKYNISLAGQDGIFQNGQHIYLKDKATGIITDLSLGDYNFSASAGEAMGRFEILYKQEALLDNESDLIDEPVVYRDGENFVIKSAYKKISRIEVFDSVGRMVYKGDTKSNELILESRTLGEGVFIIKIYRQDSLTQRKILK